MNSPLGEFLPADQRRCCRAGAVAARRRRALLPGSQLRRPYFGRYAVSGRALQRRRPPHLASLASLTASVLQVHSVAQRTTHAYVQVEAKLQHQAQILDQLHESVLTMDMTGFIISWNKGAERLFGYTAVEAVGRNILFLYDDEDTSAFHDAFLEQGGRLMEVRGRKKSAKYSGPACRCRRCATSTTADRPDRLPDRHHRTQDGRGAHPPPGLLRPLTNLPNRTLLTKLVDQALMVAQRNKAHGCVLFIDLNRFKLINDTLGRRSATNCCEGRAASAPCCATRTWWRAWAATSSPSACSTSASTSRPAWWRKSCSPR
jgi:PAS domain-containing protein